MSMLFSALKALGGAPFIRHRGKVLSFHEMVQRIAVLRNTFEQAGVQAGDVVCLECGVTEATIASLLTLLSMNTHVFPVNSRWPKAMAQQAALDTGSRFSVSSDSEGKTSVVGIPKAVGVQGMRSLDPSLVVATSGSTGVPKYAVLPLNAMFASARGVVELLGLSVSDCWQLSLPLFHVGGLGIVFRSIVAGSSLAVSEAGGLSLDAARDVTFLSLVPTQLYRLLRDERFHDTLRRQRCVLLGGAPIGADICQKAIGLGIPVVPSYGLTEMCSLVTADTAVVIGDDCAVSMGRVASGREVLIDHSGEICVRGECLFSGYLTSEGIAPSVDSQGWFHTRDVGFVDSDRALTVLGRIDAQFISGGENIHPEMIEQALTAIPPIVAACVVPLEDPEFGHRPCALVVTDGAPFDPEVIRRELRGRIPAFAIPTSIIQAPSQLVTGSGKIDRQGALRQARALG